MVGWLPLGSRLKGGFASAKSALWPHGCVLIFEGGHIYTNGSGASWSVEDDIIFSNGG